MRGAAFSFCGDRRYDQCKVNMEFLKSRKRRECALQARPNLGPAQARKKIEIDS